MLGGPALGLLLAGAVAAAEVDQRVYVCDRGVHVPVTYVVPETGPAVAVLHADGRQIAAHTVPTASGARYVSAGPPPRYTWFTKGAEAFLTFTPAMPGADPERLLTCQGQ